MEGGKPVIWLRQLITGKTLQIVLSPGDLVSGVSFSNDGQFIDYFHSAGGAFSDVSRVSILGGTTTKLLTNVHGSYSFSPDGTKLAFTRFKDHAGSVLIANADGSDEHLIITPPPGQTIMSVDWAPDGNSIAYSLGKFMSRNNEVSIAEHDLATGSERSLTDFKWNDVEGVMWLPDKSGVLVSARETVDAIHQIWLVNLPGGDARQISFDSSALKLRGASADFSTLLGSQKWLAARVWVGDAKDPAAVRDVSPAAFDVALAPDGSLVFPAADTMTTDIWISKPDGTSRRQLTNNAAVERSPAVSPDGKFIVFAASVNGKQNISRVDIDGGNPIALTNDDGSWPTFTPDGKFVLFNSLEGGSLLKVSINGGEPAIVFKGRAMRPAVSPDGSSFAYYGFKDDMRVLFVRKLDGGDLLKEVPIPGPPVTYLQPQWTADGKAVVITAEESKVANLFLQPLDGSPMKKLTNFTSDIIFDFDISTDGTRIAMVRGRWNYDTVLLSWSD
jgi:Tol biopolymer transport system component